jgi:hypothetical protein
MGRSLMHAQDTPKRFSNPVSLMLAGLMTDDSIIKPLVTEPKRAFLAPRQQTRGQTNNNSACTFCCTALEGLSAKCMDFDTRRRQLIYELLRGLHSCLPLAGLGGVMLLWKTHTHTNCHVASTLLARGQWKHFKTSPTLSSSGMARH